MNIDQKISFINSQLARLKTLQPECVEDLYLQLKDVEKEINSIEKRAITINKINQSVDDLVDFSYVGSLMAVEMMNSVMKKIGFETRDCPRQ